MGITPEGKGHREQNSAYDPDQAALVLEMVLDQS